MSIVTPLIITVIAVLIQGCLQLTPGTFSLFYHYTLAKNSTKIADNLSLNFILGIEVFITTFWLVIYALTFLIFYNQPDFHNTIFMWIMAGIFFAEAIAFFFFYYRKGKGTALFIPRKLAKNIDARARKIKTRSDAFVLGFAISSLELTFTLPLYIMLAVESMRIPTIMRTTAIIFFIISAIIPLFYIYGLYHSDYNLAEIIRLRTRIKPWIRSSVSFCFLLLSFVIVFFGVFYHG